MKITVALMRDLDQQVAREEISYSRMVEILNEVYQHQLSARDKRIKELEGSIQNTINCFEAADIEGINERLEEVPHDERWDGSLYGIVIRRLLYDVADTCKTALNPPATNFAPVKETEYDITKQE
jgi:hypothetical protein